MAITISRAFGLAAFLAGCAAQQNAYVTRIAGSEIAAALRQFEEKRGMFPDSLPQLCGGRRQDCADHAGLRLSDGWRRPFEYRRSSDGYLLLSWGRDGVKGTGDDVNYSRLYRDSLMRSMAGCWRIISVIPIRSVELIQFDTVQRETGEYRALDHAGILIGDWTPWTRDSLLATLFGRPIVELAAKVTRDSLLGSAQVFEGHSRNKRAHLRAVNCY